MTLRERMRMPPSIWNGSTSWPECRRLLPDHPWLGEVRANRLADTSGTWVVMAAVHIRWARRDSYGSHPQDCFTVDGLATSPDGADVIPAGSLLRVARLGGFVDTGCGWPGVGDTLEFGIARGTARLVLKTFEAHADSRDDQGPWTDDACWSDILAGAVIVPVYHPFARDPSLGAAAIERIREAARLAAEG